MSDNVVSAQKRNTGYMNGILNLWDTFIELWSISAE